MGVRVIFGEGLLRRVLNCVEHMQPFQLGVLEEWTFWVMGTGMFKVSRSSWLSQFTLPPPMGKGSSDSTFLLFFRFLSVFFIFAILSGLKTILRRGSS